MEYLFDTAPAKSIRFMSANAQMLESLEVQCILHEKRPPIIGAVVIKRQRFAALER